MRNPAISVISLGCPKNTADTENMLGLLKNAGFSITFDHEQADMCLINTCAFVQDARQESVNALVEMAAQGKELIITGCLAQHFKDELFQELPEARAIVGTGDIHKIVEVVKAIADDSSLRIVQVSETPNDYHEDVLPRLQTNLGPWAYLKIAEGCDHNCSFCIIPILRGRFRSRPIPALVEEAKMLADQGAHELILVSQDSTYYGIDIYGKPVLGELLEALHEVPGIDWIRIMYFYPTETSRSLLQTIAALPKVVKYIDVPLQHSHPQILSAMARPHHPERVVEQIRQVMPEAAIRSTFIVGFPGETDEHFNHLAQFIEQQRFDRLGVFAYSKQLEVPSGHMANQVPQATMKRRRKLIMEIQHQISLARNQSLIGKEIEVLIEAFDESKALFIGRSAADAPQVDNQVYVKDTEAAGVDLIGQITRVVIDEARPYDLIGHTAVAQPILVNRADSADSSREMRNKFPAMAR
jgi:ribosomal protein S12 methylthiotransferase